MKYYFIIILIIFSVNASGQYSFEGILLNKTDSTAIQFAVVKLLNTGNFTITNKNGEFKFQFSENLNEYKFEISAIGLKDSILFHRIDNIPAKIYVDVSPINLDPASVIGLSAKEIVLKAVSLIPINYTDSSFGSYSFYRQYEKVNGKFKNLIEAQAVILSKLTASKNIISTNNSFAIMQLRRSNFNYDINDFKYDQNDLSYLMDQNPIYNLESSSLNPNAFSFYTFSFDTTIVSDDYIINYICRDFSSETHGIENISEAGWLGECWESGQLIIDSKSYALKKIERSAFRNEKYHYPKNNNLLLPGRKYYVEFIDGKMIAEYEQLNGKWFLKKLCHQYTTEFFRSISNSKDFTITELRELYVDSVTHFFSSDLSDKFYNTISLPNIEYSYDKNFWNKPIIPFHFFKTDDVYRDLEKVSSLEMQFVKNGK